MVWELSKIKEPHFHKPRLWYDRCETLIKKKNKKLSLIFSLQFSNFINITIEIISVLQSPWPTHDPPPTAHLTLSPSKPLLGLLAFTSLLPPNCKWLDPSAQLHAFFSYLILLSTGTSEPQIGQTLASRGSCEGNLDRIFQILLSQFPYLCRGLIRRTFPETLPEMRGFLPSGQGLPTTLFLCNLDPRDPAWCWAHGKCPIKFGHKRM